MPNLGRVSTHKFRQVPSLLLAFRRRRGLSQRAISRACSLDQSFYCALERGRRGILQVDLVGRISQALSLNEPELEQLTWAVEHDRVLTEVMRGEASDAAPLVSAALEASRALTAQEFGGALRFVTDLVRARRQLRQAALHQPGLEEAKEQSMT